MATEQKRLAFGTLSGTSLTEIYAVPTGKTVHPFLVITNTAGTIAEIEVVVDGGGPLTLVRKKIASGKGKSWRVLEASDLRLKSADTVSLELVSGGPVNYFLSGIEFDAASG